MDNKFLIDSFLFELHVYLFVGSNIAIRSFWSNVHGKIRILQLEKKLGDFLGRVP